MARCILGLGSNLGDRAHMLRRALAELQSQHAISDVRLSSFYECAALLSDDAPPEWNIPYLNAVAMAETPLAPEALLRATQQAEQALGKRKRGHWAPREIDIDILAYDSLVMQTDNLTLPHPQLHHRDFVLWPLCEVAPAWVHPILHKTPAMMLQAIGLVPSSRLVGIANITPDSFSDGGKAFKPDAALRHIAQLIENGADIIDIGAESTRPNATMLSADDEWSRLSPVLPEALAMIQSAGRLASLDTRHPETACKALHLGIDWMNDVSGLDTPDMVGVLADASCSVVLMHHLGIPADPSQTLPPHSNPTEEVMAWFQKRIAQLDEQGIAPHRMILDVGIGFGKTAEQSLELLQSIELFHALGLPLLVGHSRKSFLKPHSTDWEAQRDDLTLRFSAKLMQRGVQYLRVHDVASHRAMQARAA